MNGWALAFRLFALGVFLAGCFSVIIDNWHLAAVSFASMIYMLCNSVIEQMAIKARGQS